MKTFDYASAWREVAKPGYQALPQNLRDLLAKVAEEAAGLGQLPDLAMPWPDDPQLPEGKRIEGSDLRERFAKIPAEWLAIAARRIYSVGHWFPSGGDLDVPGRQSGAHWKFSHYADQSLRQRLIEATSADAMRSNGPFQVHEGAIRLCYSSTDMWTWREVAPATVEGLKYARALHSELTAALSAAAEAPVTRKYYQAERERRDSAAYEFFEALKARVDWPAEWRPIMNTDQYMREEQEIATDKAITPADRLKIIEHRDEVIAKASRQAEAMLWCLDNGLHTDNAIWYDHQNEGAGVLCFGWRDKVADAIRDRILAVISECPVAYRIKCADGRVLEGGIG